MSAFHFPRSHVSAGRGACFLDCLSTKWQVQQEILHNFSFFAGILSLIHLKGLLFKATYTLWSNLENYIKLLEV